MTAQPYSPGLGDITGVSLALIQVSSTFRMKTFSPAVMKSVYQLFDQKAGAVATKGVVLEAAIEAR